MSQKKLTISIIDNKGNSLTISNIDLSPDEDILNLNYSYLKDIINEKIVHFSYFGNIESIKYEIK